MMGRLTKDINIKQLRYSLRLVCIIWICVFFFSSCESYNLSISLTINISNPSIIASTDNVTIPSKDEMAHPTWRDNDTIVFSSGQSFYLSSNKDGATRGLFKSDDVIQAGVACHAYFPSSFNGVDWQCEQTYYKDSIERSNVILQVPMISDEVVFNPIGITPTICFQNAGGFLQLSARGDKRINTVSCSIDGCDTIILDCSASAVSLDIDTPTLFNLSVPAFFNAEVVVSFIAEDKTTATTIIHSVSINKGEMLPVDAGLLKFRNPVKIEYVEPEILIEQSQGEGNENAFASGLVVSENTIFSFNSGNYCMAFDLNTCSFIQKIILPTSSHFNNAQATPFRYQEDDDYPLFLVSRGDYAENGIQDLYLMRIHGTIGSLSATIVKTIHFNGFEGEKNNCSWFVDFSQGELYAYSFPRGSWSVFENNPILFHVFKLPSLTDYNDFTITGEDIKRSIYLEDHWIMQGATFQRGTILLQCESEFYWNTTINGIAYSPYQDGNHLLFAINSDNGKIEYVMPLHNDIEQEGISIWDGYMYMSEKFTGAVGERTCFRIVRYKYDDMFASK